MFVLVHSIKGQCSRTRSTRYAAYRHARSASRFRSGLTSKTPAESPGEPTRRRYMTKYIPVNPDDLHDAYLKANRLFSFKARLFGLIGARGYGKTYLAKNVLLKRKKFKNHDFIVVRDTKDACLKLCANGGAKFFNDIMRRPAFKSYRYNITVSDEAMTIYLNGKACGEVMPLNMFYKFKGNAYDIGTILLDEFIPERNQIRSGDMAYALLHTIETIMRDRPDGMVIMTANSLDSGNEILEMLDTNIISGRYGYYCNSAKDAVIYYAPDSEEFKARRAKSLSHKIASGTRYASNLIDNEFASAEARIFERRKPCTLYGIYYNEDDVAIRIYQTKDGSEYYVTKDINPKSYTYMRYVFKVNQVDKIKKFADSKTKKLLQFWFTSGKILFESNYIRNQFVKLISRRI